VGLKSDIDFLYNVKWKNVDIGCDLNFGDLDPELYFYTMTIMMMMMMMMTMTIIIIIICDCAFVPVVCLYLQ
jgi:hypothetical protein